MKIYIDDNSKMSTALSLAARGRYSEALLLFAQVDTYESRLNQVACLGAMQEDGYASDLYRQVKQKYGLTHAVYADTLSFGDSTDAVLSFCESDRKYAITHDGELRADSNLLAKITLEIEPDYFDEDETEYFFSTPCVVSKQGFYEVSDPKYIGSLRVGFENAMMNGDEKAIRDLYKIAISFERSDVETLELQLALITICQKFKSRAALSIAKKFAACDSCNIMASGAALEIILHNRPYKNLDVLNTLAHKLLPNVDKVVASELAELAFLANDVLEDAEMAYRFAKALYAKRDRMTLDDYKVCATAFFNYGDRTLCKEAMLQLGRYVPHDKYVAFWQEFADHVSERDVKLQMGEKTVRHFFVPYEVMVYINFLLGKNLKEETICFDAADLRHISVLFDYVKSLLIVGENNKYQEMSAYVRAILHTVPPCDKQDFFDFALENLLTMVNDHLLNQTLISLLASLGFDKKAFVGLAETYQVVDFSQIPSDDKLLCSAVSIALSVTRADVPSLVAAYDKLKPLVDGEEFGLGIAHNTAYAILCIANPDFAQTEDSEYFADSEKELYGRFCAN